MSDALADVEREGVALLAALDAAGAPARLLGGVAIAQHRVRGRTEAIAAALGAAPKGLRWRARARVGRRVPWQEEPEEHGAGLHG